MTTSSYSYSTSQYPSMQLGNVIQVGNTTQTGNTLQTGEFELHGSSTTVGYHTISDTLYVEARNVSSSGTGFQLAHGGILVEEGSINLTTGVINNNYCCGLVKTSAMAITSAYTKITGFSTSGVGFDNLLSNMADTVNSKIIIRRTGKYLIQARLFAPVTGITTAALFLNAAAVPFCFQYHNGPVITRDQMLNVITVRNFTENDFIEFYAANSVNSSVGAGTYEFEYIFFSATLLN